MHYDFNRQPIQTTQNFVFLEVIKRRALIALVNFENFKNRIFLKIEPFHKLWVKKIKKASDM